MTNQITPTQLPTCWACDRTAVALAVVRGQTVRACPAHAGIWRPL